MNCLPQPVHFPSFISNLSSPPLIMVQPVRPSLSSSNRAHVLLPQSLCTWYFFHLEMSPLDRGMTSFLSSFRSQLTGHLLREVHPDHTIGFSCHSAATAGRSLSHSLFYFLHWPHHYFEWSCKYLNSHDSARVSWLPVPSPPPPQHLPIRV